MHQANLYADRCVFCQFNVNLHWLGRVDLNLDFVCLPVMNYQVCFVRFQQGRAAGDEVG